MNGRKDAAVQNSREQENEMDSSLKRMQESGQRTGGEKTAMEELDELVGCNEIKEYVKTLVFRLRLKNSEPINLNCLITGNPGVGKTKAARILSKIYIELGLLKSGHMIEVTARDLIADYVGQTSEKTRRKVMEALGGVLYIDEVHELVTEKNGGFKKEALEELMRCMVDYQGEFAVIAVGYPIAEESFNHTDPRFTIRYFANRFHMEDYTSDELYQIFNQIMVKKHLKLDDELSSMLPTFFGNFVHTRGNQTDCRVWGNAREAESLADEIMNRCAYYDGKIIQDEGRQIGIISKEHFPERLQGLLCPACDRDAAREQVGS